MKALLFIISLVLSLGNVACIGCTHIEPGEVGVEIESCSGGGVKEVPLGVGYHTTGPCTRIQEFQTTQMTLILQRRSSEDDSSLHPTSSEGLVVNTDLSFAFSIDPAKVPMIYNKRKQSLEDIAHTYVKQTVQDAVQEIFARYTAQQLYSDKKGEARSEVEKLLRAKLNPDGFLSGPVNFSRLEPPPQVVAAINAKVAMTQQAQQAEAEVKKTEAVGRQKIAQAEADAKAVRAHADAEAYANQKIASSLSPALVEYLRVQRWDGKMPQFQGNVTPMVSLGGK